LSPGSRRCAGASARTSGRSAISPPRGVSPKIEGLPRRGTSHEPRVRDRRGEMPPRRAARAASRVEARHHRRRLDP
jgi:hypothetical protein